MNLELIEELDPAPVLFDGLKDAIVGVVDRFGAPTVVLYDTEKVISTLMEDGMSRDEAVDFFEFNIIGSYVGETTPAFARFI